MKCFQNYLQIKEYMYKMKCHVRIGIYHSGAFVIYTSVRALNLPRARIFIVYPYNKFFVHQCGYFWQWNDVYFYTTIQYAKMSVYVSEASSCVCWSSSLHTVGQILIGLPQAAWGGGVPCCLSLPVYVQVILNSNILYTLW